MSVCTSAHWPRPSREPQMLAGSAPSGGQHSLACRLPTVMQTLGNCARAPDGSEQPRQPSRSPHPRGLMALEPGELSRLPLLASLQLSPVLPSTLGLLSIHPLFDLGEIYVSGGIFWICLLFLWKKRPTKITEPTCVLVCTCTHTDDFM